MAKTINFKYEGMEYTLEFTRKSVKTMENGGFNLSELDSKPMTVLPTLFAGAFLAHHKYVKEEVIDEIYAHMPNKKDLVEKLAEMYNEPIEALVSEPVDSEKNVEWGASW